jgi:PQQ-like domain
MHTGDMSRMLTNAAAAAAVALAAAACTGTPAAPQPALRPQRGPVQAGPVTQWPAYHADAARSGFVPGLPRAGRLGIGWSRRLDGAVYGQPLVVGGIVIAATENDSVYGLSRRTGRVRWRTHLATPQPASTQPCGNIDPLGITSTPVYDQQTHLVYVLAQHGRTGHLLAGLYPRTGRVRYRRPVPSPDRAAAYDQQRGALAAGNGQIYVPFGGHFGDCGPYIGSVVGMPAAGRAAPVSYLVPTKREGGIWATGGPLIGAGGTVYVSVGNGAAGSPPYDGSDSVTALSPQLRRTDLFAPAGWAADNHADRDLGSMSPVLLPAGRMLAVGKSGTGYLLSSAALGGIGGQITQASVCPAFGGAAVARQVAFIPCASGGPAAVSFSAARISVLWRGPAAADGSPVVGGGAVWVTSTSSGVLFELSMASGAVMHKIPLGSALPHFASPSLTGRLVLIGTLHGVVAVTGG